MRPGNFSKRKALIWIPCWKAWIASLPKLEPPGHADTSELEEKLRQAQDKADRLAQMGRLSEARATYFYLLDNVYGLEEDLDKTGLFSEDLKQELFEEYCQLIHEDRHLDRTLVQQEIEQLETRAAIIQGQFNFEDLKKNFLEEVA